MKPRKTQKNTAAQSRGNKRPHSAWEHVIFWLIIGLCVAGIFLGVCLAQSLQSAHATLSAPAPTPAPTAVPSPSPTPAPTPSPALPPSQEPVREIDWGALQAQNEDVVAWLEVPGTQIDYPVLFSQDRFYLDHDIDKQPSASGAVFLAPENSPAFSDRHIVIYGHNMQDGSMFAGLHEFEERAFFEKNRTVLLYMPDSLMAFEIIAAYDTDNKNLLYEADYTDDAFYDAYLSGIIENSQGEGANGTGAALSADNQLLTLSTCVENEKTRRYLLQAILISQ